MLNDGFEVRIVGVQLNNLLQLIKIMEILSISLL